MLITIEDLFGKNLKEFFNPNFKDFYICLHLYKNVSLCLDIYDGHGYM